MNTPRLTLLSALGLAAVSVLGGCKSTTVNTISREPGAQRQMITDKRVITDRTLANKVYVIGVAEAPTPGGLLQIQVEVWNRTKSRARFNYVFEWFDANGMLVNPTSTALIQAVIEGGETRLISSLAPTPLCKDFRVKFIEGSK